MGSVLCGVEQTVGGGQALLALPGVEHPHFDPVFAGGRTTVTPHDRATSPVPSVDPSSTTMISSGGVVCAWIERIVSATQPASS